MLSLRRWLALSLLFGSAAILPFSVMGCSSEEKSDAVTGDEDEIVNIPHTDVKNQSIGNCWTYATIGWVESQHLRATGNTLNLSESYLTYWDWYEKLIREPGSEKLSTGGWFSTAVKVFNKYGLIEEGGFIPNEANIDRSASQSAAEAAINASMTSGALKKDRSPKTVRDELNKAWKLTPEVIASLNAVFGETTPKTLSSTSKIPAGFPLKRSTEIEVVNKKPNQAGTKAALKDVMGRWQEFSLPSSASARRAYLRRVQKALHDGHPVIIVWDVSWGSRDKLAGSFPAMKADAKIDGRHMTLLEDYQATNVPNFGLLPAGVTISDSTTLNAALANQANIQFFRIKNSWGQTADPSGTGQFKGYVDLYADYLLPTNGAPNGLVSFIFPSDYTDTLPSGIEQDRCNNAKSDGLICGATLTSNESDKRLFTCKDGKTASMSPCAAGCDATSTPACVEPPPPNPCEEIGVDVPGLYCGDSLAMLPSDPGYNNLYSCQIDPTTGKWVSPSTPCASGCAVQPPGVPDRCNLEGLSPQPPPHLRGEGEERNHEHAHGHADEDGDGDGDENKGEGGALRRLSHRAEGRSCGVSCVAKPCPAGIFPDEARLLRFWSPGESRAFSAPNSFGASARCGQRRPRSRLPPDAIATAAPFRFAIRVPVFILLALVLVAVPVVAVFVLAPEGGPSAPAPPPPHEDGEGVGGRGSSAHFLSSSGGVFFAVASRSL